MNETHRGDPPDSAPGPTAAAQTTPDMVEMPVSTVWPMVLALAIMLAASGLVLNYAFSVAGAILFAVALSGWVHQLLPGAGEEEVPLPPRDQWPRVQPKERPVADQRRDASRPRRRLPETVHPIRAGVLGGIAGGIAMALVALVYGLFAGRGIWYPVNLLGAMLLPGTTGLSIPQLEQFHLAPVVLGLFIHGCASLAAGLLFALLLPMLPARPVIWGGIVAPLLWSGGVYAFMGVLNPVLNERVDWAWFIASQFAFGLAAGIVIARSEEMHTPPVTESPP